MTCHAIFREEDIFPNKNPPVKPVVFEERPTVKAVVFDIDGRVALVGKLMNNFYLLPGGGIHQWETVEESIARECLEEIGCKIKLLHNLGTTEDYRTRDKKHCINYCYSAEVDGNKGEQQLTKEELENGMYVRWFSVSKAVQIFEDQLLQLQAGEVDFYNTGFNIVRDRIFLLEALKYIK